MNINRRDLLIVALVTLGLLFLAFLPIANGDWSVAKAQGTNPPTLTPDPNDPNRRAFEVPEADTIMLVGGGLGGLAVWLGWQLRKIESKKP